MGAAVCAQCGAPLARAAKFCGGCGRATRGHRRAVAARFAGARARATRTTRAVATVFAGVLLGLTAVWKLVESFPELEPQAWWMLTALELALGVLAVRMLGAGAARRSLAGPLDAKAHWWTPLAGVATFALAHGYVSLLRRFAGDVVATEVWTAPLVLEVVVAAPLVEEWLCRGVLWDGLRRVATTRTTIVATAVLFGLLHCLSEGLLGFPHRFALGLVLGWLRARTGSLLPCIAAHAVHNALAVVA